MPNRAEIRIRDPFVVPVAAEGRYYLYGTTGISGFDVYTGRDLDAWEGPFPAFRPPPGFWADRDFWAPEVHRYRGRFYMFASLKSDDACRGTQILAADALAGPFVLHSAGPVTPRDWECLDGTLFVDPGGQPWMVFCHEWVQVQDGEMCAMPLSPDLKEAAGDPVLLFRASDAPWAVEFVSRQRHGWVTDGPFLHRTAGGALLMLWSSFGVGGYALGIARSESGQVAGPWAQARAPLVADDGGHGMLFRTLDGQLLLALHRPNRPLQERSAFIPVREQGDDLVLD